MATRTPRTLTTAVLLLACLLLGLPQLGSAAPKDLDLELVTRGNAVAAGRPVVATASIGFKSTVHHVIIRVRGTGVTPLTLDGQLPGPWHDGDVYSYDIVAFPSGVGEGVVTITVEAYGSSGTRLYARSARLYILAETARTWFSGSSPTDLRIKRARALAAASRTASAAGADPLAEIITARPRTDRTPRPPKAMNAHDLKVQNTFNTLAPKAPALRAPAPAARGTGAVGPAAAVTLTVKGRVQWTDRNGGVHGLPMATVEIRDDDVLGLSNLITSVQTNAVGDYIATFTHDDGLLQGNPDIFVRVLARSPVADIKPDATGAQTYRMESAVINEVPNGTTLTINLTAGNVNDNETVFSLHHALVVIGGYAGGLAGVMPSQIDTRFPTTKSTSLFNGTQLHILRLDRWDWDVIHHEYGHYFMEVHGFENNPGGPHSFGQNLAQSRGSKDVGIRLAWGEGWPTFFGISGQQVMGVAALSVPDAGNTSYEDTEDATTSLDLETRPGVGEDNEVSVMSVLWDLFDGASDGDDKLGLGDRFLFTTIKAAAAKTVGSAWEALAATQDTRGKTVMGGVFGQANIAPVPLEPADNIQVTAADPPTFKWKRNGGGPPNPLNDFTLKFYKNDFSALIFEKNVGDVEQYTPTAAEFATILGGDALVKWVVEGANTSAPATSGGALGKYWSKARTLGGIKIAFVIDDTGSMEEEIAAVSAALQAFITEVESRLMPGETPPTIQVITFKDNVTVRLTSNDLAAVRSVVAGLFADGGGDCPEFSAHALQTAAENIAPGGTIMLATDASPQPGVDIGALIAQLRARGVTVNVILSGDCSGIGSSTLAVRTRAPVTNQLRPSGAQSAGKPGEAGDDEPPVGPIIDIGQPLFDDHANTAEAATPIPVDGTEVRGHIGFNSDTVDFFVIALEAGRTYALRFRNETPDSKTFALLDRNGTTVMRSLTTSSTLRQQFTFTPTVGGNYFFRVTRSATVDPRLYLVSALDDPFATLDTAVELFSTIAAGTGGAFIVRDNVNFGDTTEYESAILNIMLSTLGPAVLTANPDDVPQGATLGISLTGRDTNWRAGTLVRFSGTGLNVLSVDVHSATALTAIVQVDAAAALGFRNVEIETTLGAATELAMGINVVEVVTPIVAPVLLSVEPSGIGQGESERVTVRGINTAWGPGSTLTLGPGITVTALTVLSPTLIQANIAVTDTAAIGFRTASVATPGQGTQSKQRALFVSSGVEAIPEIIQVTPAEGTPGQTLDVTVNAVNTTFEAGLTTASFGSGVTVVSVSVVDPLTAVVRITIQPGAAPGFRDVNLTTEAEVAVLLDGFFIRGLVLAGDLDGDGDIDRDDIAILLADRNKPVAGSACGARCDLDGDGMITVLDARRLILQCTRTGCAR